MPWSMCRDGNLGKAAEQRRDKPQRDANPAFPLAIRPALTIQRGRLYTGLTALGREPAEAETRLS